MNQRYSWLVMVVLAGLCSCGKKATVPVPPVPVTTAQAVTKTMSLAVEAMGSVEAYNSLEIIPRVSGQILKLHFRDGDEVQKDALLVTIDPAPFTEALREVEARLASDAATLVFKTSEAERKSRLIENDGISRSEFEKARAEADAQKNIVQADRAVVEQACLNVGYCSMRSPIPGRAGAYVVNQGGVVEANKTTLLVVNQVKPIYVTFSVPEKCLPGIRAAQEKAVLTVEARVPGADAQSRQGRLTFIDNTVDPATGMIRLKGTFANTDAFLWPGLYVQVSLMIGEEPGAVVVPASAVAKGPKGDQVFVVKAGGTAELRAVQVRRMAGDEVVLDGGVSSGETVVTDGLNKLKDGAAIVIANTPASAATNAASGTR
ncbi:MAG: efflux RND transporter periplasmic adaptor subunit [Verrucomicrobia bacterium]|nr:efflux RND transporter periplasmic adaptor subunit [Verrucomicrobiota bacterium]MBU1734478.1 efflux RND transporter periplasmic adaptor subunit [Verrucomicrobiota bacterium]MBU1856058.1 efflux RND transporter periplasmic adaptor subunit [Verrucomicrobiota bacterium]